MQPCPAESEAFDICDPDELAARHFAELDQMRAARRLAVATAAAQGRYIAPAPLGTQGADHWKLTDFGLRYLELTRDRGTVAIGGGRFPSSGSGQSSGGNSSH